MKIRIEFDEQLQEEEIIIRCSSLTEKIQKIQKTLSEIEYYLNLEDILFFETGLRGIEAHTKDNIFQCKFKLYELEKILPSSFMRISKSAILNTTQVYAINRNLTASSVIEFQHTHKQVYVSRNYYKPLKTKLEEMR